MIMKETIEELVNRMNESAGGVNKTVITKPKAPPIWNMETFERYKEQVDHWNRNSTDSDLNKYLDLLEKLKKKKDLKDSVMNTVLDRTQTGEKTVKNVMEKSSHRRLQRGLSRC